MLDGQERVSGNAAASVVLLNGQDNFNTACWSSLSLFPIAAEMTNLQRHHLAPQSKFARALQVFLIAAGTSPVHLTATRKFHWFPDNQLPSKTVHPRSENSYGCSSLLQTSLVDS